MIIVINLKGNKVLARNKIIILKIKKNKAKNSTSHVGGKYQFLL